MEKQFVCSDIHEDIEAMKAFLDYASAQSADRILCLGDLSFKPYTREDLERLVATEDVDSFIKAKRGRNSKKLNEFKDVLDNSQIPYVVIPGNYDPDFENIFGDNDLHLRNTVFGEAKISGYGGADAFPPHIGLLNRFNEIVPFDHKELYEFLKSENPDIDLTHNPPKGLCDDMFNGQNVGTPATTQYIQENSPKIVLAGHIHEAGPLGNNPNGVQGIAQSGSSIIVNPGNLGRFGLLDGMSLEPTMQFDYGTFAQLDVEADGSLVAVSQYSLSSPERGIGKVKNLQRFFIK